jgi:hypothetical protein
MIETHTFENLKVDEVYPFFKIPSDSLSLICSLVANGALFEFKVARKNDNDLSLLETSKMISSF